MGNQGKRKTDHKSRTPLKPQRGPTGSSEPHVGKRYAIWLISGLVAVAVAIVALVVLRHGAPGATAIAKDKPVPADDSIQVEVSSGAKLTMNETKFDFGIVPQRARVSHVFWLHSTGTDSLKILRINPG